MGGVPLRAGTSYCRAVESGIALAPASLPETIEEQAADGGDRTGSLAGGCARMSGRGRGGGVMSVSLRMLACGLAVVVCGAAASQAADIARPVYKAAPMMAPSFNWSG